MEADRLRGAARADTNDRQRRVMGIRSSKARLRVAALAVLGAVYGTAIAFGQPPMTVHTGAKLKVLAPKTGTTLRGNTLRTLVSITHFKVDCRYAGTANRKGIGHYHIELDKSLINMFCSPRGQVSMLDVKPGKHTVQFIPAANDHADDMKAMKQIRFTYQPSHPLPAAKPINFPGKPSIKIVSPKPGATVHGGFKLVVAVKNFRLSCALYGKAPLKGYGHWHANVDTTSKGMMGMGTMLGMSCARSFHVSLVGIKPGQHKFIAILEDNTHAPTIGAQASVKLNVK
jgi:hypothetical protein